MSAVTWNGDGARTMKSAISRATDASGSISNPLFEKPSVYKAHVNRNEAVDGRRHRFAQRSAIPPGNSVLVSSGLGPAVALAERVDGVNLTEVVGQPLSSTCTD